ncbi:MAG: ATP-binding protein, partial [Frankiaceae bacterium]
AEIGYVRVCHHNSTEDLTFFEAVVVAAALTLPPTATLGVALGGLLLACAILRRPLLKTAFNLGSYASGTALLVSVAHGIGAGTSPFAVRTVVGLIAGTLAFAAWNLLALAMVLAAVEGLSVRAVVEDEWRLSAFMAVGNAGVGMTAVALGQAAPVLLPFVALPVLALGHSYRSAARQASERERNRWLVTLGGLLAGHADRGVLAPTVEATRGLFAVDVARIVVADCTAVADEDGSRLVPRQPGDDALLATVATASGPVSLRGAAAVPGWAGGTVVPLEMLGGVRGALVLAWLARPAQRGERPWRSGHRRREPDRVMLTAVPAAIANALRAADHLTALTEESSKLQAMVEHGTDGIAVLDADGGILVWSPAMARLTGTAAAALDSSRPPGVDPLHALLRQLGGADTDPEEWVRALPTGAGRSAAILTVRDGDGERRDLDVTAVRIGPDPTAARLTVLTVHDVTEARRLERLKADFIATVSHELRTPITPIKGYAQLLAARGPHMDPARWRQGLRTIEDRADHLSRLVDDLLLASRVGADAAKLPVNLTDVDLGVLVNSAVSAFPVLHGRLAARLPADPVIARCDSVRTMQCLSNLISNAEKYSPPQSGIDIVLTAGPEGTAALAVIDRGRGIPSAERGRVFERFHRVENAFTTSTSGSGLGLYIARELARAMGGDLKLDSTLGEGTTVTLRLPLIPAEKVVQPVALATASGPSG